MTHSQSNPDVKLCVFLLQDTDDLVSLWQLVKVELDNLHKTVYSSSAGSKPTLRRTHPELGGDKI